MAFQAVLWDPLWAPSSGLAMLEGCWEVMKSEDVIVKSEGTLHTSPFLITRPVLLILLWALPGGLPNLTVYILYIFGQVI